MWRFLVLRQKKRQATLRNYAAGISSARINLGRPKSVCVVGTLGTRVSHGQRACLATETFTILDHSRILLVKLPKVQIGRENANLLGSIFVSKIQQMAMSRQRMKKSERQNFLVYLDEFHSFITPSMAEILPCARKYRVGLMLAHQELHQLEADRDVASAVPTNCCTRVAFRVSDRDARELDSGFAHFEKAHLQNLGICEAICRLERSEADFNLSVCEPDSVDEAEAEIARQGMRRISNERYARPRREVEADLIAKMRR